MRRIVEQHDATAQERKIREANTGVLAVHASLLKRWLAKLKNRNAQQEYYLTDIIEMAAKDKIKVMPLIAPTSAEVLGSERQAAARRTGKRIPQDARP